MGDKLLESFVREAEKQLDVKKHMFARIGGDEFLLMFEGTTDHVWAENALSQIQESLQQEGKILPGCSIPVTFSVGFAAYPEDGINIEELVAAADQKMYQYKKTST